MIFDLYMRAGRWGVMIGWAGRGDDIGGSARQGVPGRRGAAVGPGRDGCRIGKTSTQPSLAYVEKHTITAFITAANTEDLRRGNQRAPSACAELRARPRRRAHAEYKCRSVYRTW